MQLSEHQTCIHQLESNLEGRTEELKSASGSAARVPELEMQLSLRNNWRATWKLEPRRCNQQKICFIKLKKSAK